MLVELIEDRFGGRAPGTSAFRVNPYAAHCHANGSYVLEQSTASKRVVAIKRLPLLTYIYASKTMVSKNMGDTVKEIIASLFLGETPVPKVGCVVCAAIFEDVTLDVAQRKQGQTVGHENVVVLQNATQYLYLSQVFPINPVFSAKRPPGERQCDRWFQLTPEELKECHKRLVATFK
jgi:hypothetical protein